LPRLTYHYPSSPLCANCTVHVQAAELVAAWLVIADSAHLLQMIVVAQAACTAILNERVPGARNCNL
jgi:hypothetical protein